MQISKYLGGTSLHLAEQSGLKNVFHGKKYYGNGILYKIY